MSQAQAGRWASVERVATTLRERWLSVRAHLRADLDVWGDVRAFPPLAVWSGLICVGFLAIARRYGVSASMRLTANQTMLVAAVAAILAVAARVALARVESRRPAAWLRVLSGVACGLPLFALCVVMSAKLGVFAQAPIALLAIACGLFGASWCDRGGQPQAKSRRGRLIDEDVDEIASRKMVVPLIQHDTQATAWIERRSLPMGEELIQGIVVVEFAAGQAVAVAHVAFCPPLKRIPQLSFEPRDEKGLRIKAAGVYLWGCRFELKRTRNLSDARRVEIRFRAEACGQMKSAA